MKSVVPLYFVGVIAAFSVAVTASSLTSTEPEELVNGVLKGSLATSCEVLKTDPSSSGASSCRYYIYGFVNAGQAIDRVSAEQLKEDDNQRPSFTERAYRTRVGQFDERTKTTEILVKPFCVSQEESIEAVINLLAKHLPHSIDNLNMLSNSVYKGFTTEFPCS